MGRQDLLGWMGRRRGSNLASVEPATGRQLVDVGAAAPEDVQRAVQRASDAQQAWAATPHDIRATVLRRAADLLAEHQVELEDWVVREARVCRAISPARWAPRRSSVRPPRSPALHWVRFCRRCSRGCLLPAAGPWMSSGSLHLSTLPSYLLRGRSPPHWPLATRSYSSRIHERPSAAVSPSRACSKRRVSQRCPPRPSRWRRHRTRTRHPPRCSRHRLHRVGERR
jgi:hypothetical protein